MKRVKIYGQIREKTKMIFLVVFSFMALFLYMCSSEEDTSGKDASGLSDAAGDALSGEDAVTGEDAGGTEDKGGGGGQFTTGPQIIAITDDTPTKSTGVLLYDVDKDKVVYTIPNTVRVSGEMASPKYVKLKWNKDRSKIVGVRCEYSTSGDTAYYEIFDPETGDVSKSMSFDPKIACGSPSYTISPDESKIYYIAGYPSSVYVVEFKEGAASQNLTEGKELGAAGGIHINPSGTKLFFANGNGSMFLMNTDGSGFEKVSGVGAMIGKWIDDENLIIYDMSNISKFNVNTKQAEIIGTFSSMCMDNSIVISPDGKRVLCAGNSLLFDTVTKTDKKLSFKSYNVAWNSF